MKNRRRLIRALALPAVLACILCALSMLHITAFAANETLEYHSVVALVNFSDSETKFTAQNTSEIQSIFNSEAEVRTDEANLESYLFTVSRGKIRFKSHFFVIDLPANKTADSYRTWSGNSWPPLFLDAFSALEAVFDSQKPDVNFGRNGVHLDGLTFYLNADTTSDRSDLFWPHQTTVTNSDKTLAGLVVDKYMIVPKGIQDQTGNSFLQVLCHETLHMFGADDLYHYSNADRGYEQNPAGYDELYPVGAWDIMGAGKSYNEPTSVNSYYRYKHKLIGDNAFLTAETGKGYVLSSSLSQTGAVGLKFGERTINGNKEFFVLEKRDLSKSYDASLAKYSGMKSGFTVYRVKTLTDENGKDLSTGNRKFENGDEIVYFDSSVSDSQTGRIPTFSANLPETGIVADLTYSDGSKCDLRLRLDNGEATAEEILTDFRVTVTFGGNALTSDAFQLLSGTDAIELTADAQTETDGSYAVTAPRGSALTVEADGYTFTEPNFTVDDGLETLVFAAMQSREFRFTDGEKPIAGIRTAVLGTDRIYLSGDDGIIRVLFGSEETAEFAAHGYSFDPPSYTLAAGSERIEIALTKTERTLTINLGERVTGTVSVSIDGGEAEDFELEGHILTLSGILNGARISIFKDSFGFSPVTVDHLTADDGFEVQVTEFLTLSGRITANGEAVAKVTFHFYVNEQKTGSFTTDENGNFMIENIPNGAKLSVKATGYFVAARVIEGGTLDFQAEKLFTLPAYWLAVPAFLFLIVIIVAFARDYRRKK